MKIEIYDQFKKVFDDNNVLIHPSKSNTSTHGEYPKLSDALKEVSNLYNESKKLGSCKDILVDLKKGSVDIVIIFSDKRVLQRVIYIKE